MFRCMSDSRSETRFLVNEENLSKSDIDRSRGVRELLEECKVLEPNVE